MIRAKQLIIRDFRGIKSLTLDLGGKNFAVCGPNGTGKSGIVDALEFALTGNISRLAGAGTGALSVKEHGPHVDSRNKPESASVSLTVHIPSLKKDATIVRNVKDARTPSISPPDADVTAIFAKVAIHPEFALSRRELIRYVLAEPGKRAKEVQELLRLDDVETLRALFQRIANASDRDVKILKASKEESSASLQRALGLTKLSVSDILVAANEQRTLLGLLPIAALDSNASIKDGIASAATSAQPPKLSKLHARNDVDALATQLATLQSADFLSLCAKASALIAKLAKDETFLQSASRSALLQSALALFDDSVCPVCDTSWTSESFRKHIATKLAHFEAVSAQRKEAELRLAPILAQLEAARAAATNVAKFGPLLIPAVDCTSLTTYAANVSHVISALRAFLPVTSTVDALASASKVDDSIGGSIGNLKSAIAAIPEPTLQDAARDFLIVGQERLENYRNASLKHKSAEQRAEVARTVLDTYGVVTTNALDDIYKKVEVLFSKLYRLVNHDDEKDFQAQLKPSIGKLGFDVDFYGRGFFPPGAYHSEGHQDSMGLCLYLALMSYLAGEAFTFAVLDDVLMSVDAGHRREVSKMLREQFPDTQFLLTTHDEVWLRHMSSVGLIEPKRFAHFRTWNVDIGPTEWDDRDVWQEIDAHLAANNVHAAASLLRNYLEHFAKEACQNLRASVEFHGDAQFTLGDLLPNAVSKLLKLYRAGKDVAAGWAQSDKVAAIGLIEEAFSKTAQTSQVDQWQLNAAVHYNEWANLHAKDFAPVAKAFKALVEGLCCSKCGSLLYVVPTVGKSEALRCGCGVHNINLVKKG